MKTKKWISRAVTSVLTIVFLLTLVFAVTSKVSGGPPKVMGYQMMNVLSGSMEPGIHTGSVIAIRPGGDMNRFQEGDVITFRSADNANITITHRIKEVLKASGSVQYVTKGDANDSEDPAPVPAVNVIGQYSNFTVPYLGYTISFVQSKAGVISLMIVPGALLILWQMISMWLMITRLDDKKEKPEEVPQNAVNS